MVVLVTDPQGAGWLVGFHPASRWGILAEVTPLWDCGILESGEVGVWNA